MKFLCITKGTLGPTGERLDIYHQPVMVISERVFRGIKLFSYSDTDKNGLEVIIVSEYTSGFQVPGAVARSGRAAWAKARKSILDHGIERTQTTIRAMVKACGAANPVGQTGQEE